MAYFEDPRLTPDPTYVECEECGGTGMVTVEEEGEEPCEEVCPRCQGEGQVESDEEYSYNGDDWWDERHGQY